MARNLTPEELELYNQYLNQSPQQPQPPEDDSIMGSIGRGLGNVADRFSSVFSPNIYRMSNPEEKKSSYIPAISELDASQPMPILQPMLIDETKPVSNNFQPMTNVDPYSQPPTKPIGKEEKNLPKKSISPKPVNLPAQSPKTAEIEPLNKEDAGLNMQDMMAFLNQKEEGGREDLLAAQQAAMQNRMNAAILRSGQEIGAAIAGAKPNTDFADMMYKEADRPLLERQQLIENQKNDPQSRESLLAKQVYKKFTGEEAPANFTAKAFEKFVGPLQHFQTSKENREARKEEAKERQKERNLILAGKKEEAKTKVQTKEDEKKEADARLYRQEAHSGEHGKKYQLYSNAATFEENARQFSKNPNGFTDYGTLMGGLKSLQGDTSVVREAEIKLGMKATSLPNKINNWLSSLESGKMLQPEQRKQIADALSVMKETYRRSYQQSVKPIYNQAKRRGLEMESVFNPEDIQGIDKVSEPSKQGPAPGTIIKKGNKTYRVLSDGFSVEEIK